MKIDPDEPAFPIVMGGFDPDPGLTVRAYMATQIMAAYRSAEPDSDGAKIAEWSVGDADNLIKELNKGQTP